MYAGCPGWHSGGGGGHKSAPVRDWVTRWIEIFLICMDRCRHKEASLVVFEFLKCLQRLSIEINLFPPVSANTSWLIMLVA
jgi:hypothetical protein